MPYKNSEKTKRILSNALKSLLKEKELSKITIQDITNKCRMNRNSFYYHFADISSIVKWTLEQEPLTIANTVDPKNFRKTLENTITYVENNKFILNCVFDSFGREQLKKYFYSSVYKAIETMVDNAGDEADSKYIGFVRHCLTEMVGASLLEYFRDNGKTYTKEEIIEYLTRLIQSNRELIRQKRFETLTINPMD